MEDKEWTPIVMGDWWKTCYLHDVPNRKKQVLDDLKIEVNKGFKFNENVVVDVTDHSMAVECFEVVSVNMDNKNVFLNYAGGAS